MVKGATATAGPRRQRWENRRNPHGEREFTRPDKKLATVGAFTTVSPGLRFCDQSPYALPGGREMKKFVLACSVLVAAAAALPLGAAGEKMDYEAINKIKQQGMNPQISQVMEISSWLTDVHGPRLTGSPTVKAAGEWAVAKMKEWGLQNVALEPWADKTNQFGYGWTNDKFYMAAVSPQAFPIPGTPTSWTPGTNGPVRGEVVLVTEATQEDLQKYAGKLKGKWILTQAAPDVAAFWNPLATRQTAEELESCCAFLRARAMHSLMIEARLRRLPLPDLLGQLKLPT